eukprot:scaffold583_cov279-Chaetoceros_neogracile.AAC.31
MVNSSKDVPLAPHTVRSWLASNHPKQIALLDKFEMELRLGRLSASAKAKKSASDEMSKNYGGVSSRDRVQVTSRTVELLRDLIGNTKWKNAAQLMALLQGVGRELHAAGGGKEPAIANIVMRVMCAVRDEVATAEANEQAAAKAKAQEAKRTMEPIDELADESLSKSLKDKASLSSKAKPNQGASVSRNLSLASMLWAHPQHLTMEKLGTSSASNVVATRAKRSDSFSSVDSSSDPLNNMSNDDRQFPPSFYATGHQFRGAVIEAIKEIMFDLEDLHKNIDDQAFAHIHAGEVILTYSRSKTVESFLKAAAKKRKFQVIVCEGAPHFGGHNMANSLAKAGIDTTVIHDSAAFAIMARVNKVLLPAHAVLANGGLVAPSGAHMLALAAAHNSVPLVCLTGMFKLCPMYPHEGQDTLQDLVSPSSVIEYAEMSDQMMSKVELINAVHDYIKPDLVNLYVTNIGAFQPSYIYRLLAEYYSSDDWGSFD